MEKGGVSMGRVRARIRLTTNKEAVDFVSLLNSDGTAIRYSLENGNGDYRVDARSLLGVIYFTTEYGDDTYFVNDTTGEIPTCIDKFRI